VVVLATPPFWLLTAIVVVIACAFPLLATDYLSRSAFPSSGADETAPNRTKVRDAPSTR
jgi:amino acid transporter